MFLQKMRVWLDPNRIHPNMLKIKLLKVYKLITLSTTSQLTKSPRTKPKSLKIKYLTTNKKKRRLLKLLTREQLVSALLKISLSRSLLLNHSQMNLRKTSSIVTRP